MNAIPVSLDASLAVFLDFNHIVPAIIGNLKYLIRKQFRLQTSCAGVLFSEFLVLEHPQANGRRSWELSVECASFA
jgi:hypothetical protein